MYLVCTFNFLVDLGPSLFFTQFPEVGLNVLIRFSRQDKGIFNGCIFIQKDSRRYNVRRVTKQMTRNALNSPCCDAKTRGGSTCIPRVGIYFGRSLDVWHDGIYKVGGFIFNPSEVE